MTPIYSHANILTDKQQIWRALFSLAFKSIQDPISCPRHIGRSFKMVLKESDVLQERMNKKEKDKLS